MKKLLSLFIYYPCPSLVRLRNWAFVADEFNSCYKTADLRHNNA